MHAAQSLSVGIEARKLNKCTKLLILEDHIYGLAHRLPHPQSERRMKNPIGRRLHLPRPVRKIVVQRVLEHGPCWTERNARVIWQNFEFSRSRDIALENAHQISYTHAHTKPLVPRESASTLLRLVLYLYLHCEYIFEAKQRRISEGCF